MLDFDALVLQPCEATFAEPVLWQAPGRRSLTVLGVFTEAFADAKFAQGEPASTDRPRLGARRAQFPPERGPEQDDMLTVRGRAFLVSDVAEDGIGHLHLTLRHASDR